jgi:hypothetical protein
VRDHPGVVLVVRVDHHHHVRPVLQGVAVARLLVAAVARVLVVDDHRQAHLPGDLDGAVIAAVVHQEDVVHAAGREVGDGRGEGALRVVGGEYRDDLVLARRDRDGRLEDPIDVKRLGGRAERRAVQ